MGRLRGARRRDGGQVHLLSALDTSTGIVLAQVTIAAKSNEIPAFAPLLDAVEQVLGSLTGLLFIADALHAQTAQAEEIAARGAYLMIPAKGNQPTLFAQLKALPWPEIPIGDRRRDTGHGRRESHHPADPRRDQVPPRRAGRPDHPDPHHRREDQPRGRLLHGVSTRRAAQPADLQDWARREWHIEDMVHHVRDVTFREDLHQARTGTGPAVLATLRNTSIGYHRTNGDTNIARATRRANRRPHDLITAVTSTYPTTQ
ncbi:transposase [Micromonospora coerulea]|uniref:transposase n=1 Tax=Micromonospora coerulea TaxID=47856 RepID=UPI001F3ADAE2|nr:transposase [Micromonospora veneta]